MCKKLKELKIIMNTNYNFSIFKSIGGGSKTKFYSGQKFKHFTSIGPMNDETSTNYSGQGEEDNNKNIINNEQAILYSFYIQILLKLIGKKNLTK